MATILPALNWICERGVLKGLETENEGSRSLETDP